MLVAEEDLAFGATDGANPASSGNPFGIIASAEEADSIVPFERPLKPLSEGDAADELLPESANIRFEARTPPGDVSTSPVVQNLPFEGPALSSADRTREFEFDLSAGADKGTSAEQLHARAGAAAADEDEGELDFESEFDLEEPFDQEVATAPLIDRDDAVEFEFDAAEADTELEMPPRASQDTPNLSPAPEFEGIDLERPDFEEPRLDSGTARGRSDAQRPDSTAVPKVKAKPRQSRRRKPSRVMGLVGYALSAVIGLGLGYIILLWILPNPETDFLDVAGKLPSWMVPLALRTEPADTEVAITDVTSSPPIRGEVEQRLNSPTSPFSAVEPRSTPPQAPPTTSPSVVGADSAASPPAAIPIAAPGDASTDASASEAASVPQAPDEPASSGDSKPTLAAPPTTIASTVNRPPLDGSERLIPAGRDEEQPPPAETKEPVGPINAPRFSMSDVEEAVGSVRQSAAALRDIDPAQARKAKVRFYKQLYHMAGVLTLADSSSDQNHERKVHDDVRALAREIADDPQRRGELGTVARQWLSLSPAKRGEHQGVLLMGRVEQVVRQGTVYEIRVALPGSPQPITIVTAKDITLAPHNNIVVLGSIVEDAPQAIQGYSGAEPVVVWSGMILPTDG